MSCPANNGCLLWAKEKRLHGGGVGPEMRSPAGLSTPMLNGGRGSVNEKSLNRSKVQHP